jgi:hypothetical protein
MKSIRSTLLVLAASLACAVTAEAQFRRGLFGEASEVTLFPIQAPATLLPEVTVDVSVRNLTGASARIVDRFKESLERQLTSNDTRLTLGDKNAAVTIVATLTEWTQNRRNSTKYVSETRQVGTRQVTDKNGKTKTEPVYEYGRNRPSVVISGAAGVRLEVQRRAGATALAEETVRHTIQEEHLVDANPPSRDAVEDLLLDNVVQKAAGRISPGRSPVQVLLARSTEVDPLNELAQSRRWRDWLNELQTVKPNRDRKRDAYRLHNVAVAHEAIAYEAAAPDEALESLGLASRLIAQAAQMNDDEKYIAESAERISRSTSAYQQLATLYAQLGDVRPAPRERAATTPPSARDTVVEKTRTAEKAAAALTNKDVIDLVVAGLDDENLIATVSEAKTVNFDLTPAGLKTLLAGKVSNRVINAMRARAKR